MRRIIIAALALAMMAQVVQAGAAPAFQVGQKWSIKDSGMQIVIGRIDPFPGAKTPVSISLFDMPCPPEAGCTTITLAHVPFDSDALAKSVDRLMGEHQATAPQFEEGYATWQLVKGGIYTIPVSQLPQVTFATVLKGQAK